MTFFWISQGKLVKYLHLTGEVDKPKIFYVKFYQDLPCQKSLKSVNFGQSYSKNKRWTFCGTRCIYTPLRSIAQFSAFV